MLQCGPAGEKGVRYRQHYRRPAQLPRARRAGRGDGQQEPARHRRARHAPQAASIADREGLKKVATWFAKSTKGHPAIGLHHELGTAKGIVPVSVSGILPTYNFQDGSFAGAEDIGGERMKKVAQRQHRDLLRLRRILQALGGRRATGGFTVTREIRRPGVRDRSACWAPIWAWTISSPWRPATSCATGWGWTPSPPAARSPGRWSASSAACSPKKIPAG